MKLSLNRLETAADHLPIAYLTEGRWCRSPAACCSILQQDTGLLSWPFVWQPLSFMFDCFGSVLWVVVLLQDIGSLSHLDSICL